MIKYHAGRVRVGLYVVGFVVAIGAALAAAAWRRRRHGEVTS